MRKRWYFSKKKENLFFPIAEERIKPLGGDQDLKTSTIDAAAISRGESHVVFLGESEGSLPPPHDSFPDAGEAIYDFLVHVRKLHIPPSRWTQSETLLAERRFMPYSTEVHWRIQNYLYKIWMSSKRNASMIIGMSMGQEDLSDPWTGFHPIYLLEEKPPDGYMWSGGRLTRKQQTSRPDHLWPEIWKTIGKNAKLKEKQKWSNEKLHLDKRTKVARDLFHWPGG